MNIDDWLLDILACPKCHAPLRVDEAASELRRHAIDPEYRGQRLTGASR